MEAASYRYNYYDILEVSPHCPQHEVTSAYERAKVTYSGENPAIYTMFSADEARDLLRLVEEAYSVLGNKNLRALYDERIGQKRPVVDLTFKSLEAESKIALGRPLNQKFLFKSDYSVDNSSEQQIKETAAWTGQHLQQVRNYKQFSLEKLSEITKISSFYIKALEEMEPQNLPAPVYVRGYIRQIAKTLGLDERKVCDSYMKIFNELLEKKQAVAKN